MTSRYYKTPKSLIDTFHMCGLPPKAHCLPGVHSIHDSEGDLQKCRLFLWIEPHYNIVRKAYFTISHDETTWLYVTDY